MFEGTPDVGGPKPRTIKIFRAVSIRVFNKCFKSNKIAPNHNKNIRVAPKNSTMESVIGIDVGTGSVRGCAFDFNGNQISEPEGSSQIHNFEA